MEQKKCQVAKKCGGCQYQGVAYEKQLKIKQEQVKKLLAPFGKVKPVIPMENPYYYGIKYMRYSAERKTAP